MRADARKTSPSSSSPEEDEGGKQSVKPSLISTGESPSLKKKKNEDAPIEANFKLKRHREDPFQGSSKKKKTSKKSVDKSGIDLEELLAQTYPKVISAPVETANQIPIEASDHRSNRKKKRPAKRVGDSAKKWSGDEEISLSMALLECSSPGGEINISAFYQRAKESLHDEVSNTQLYDKMRSMKKRFRAIQSKLKEHNVAEEEFPYRTHQEPALFRIWKRIWTSNGDNDGIHAEIPKENDGQYLSEFENPGENVVQTPKEIENENSRRDGAENSREIRDENSMEIEGENPRDYEFETTRKKEAESPMINDDEREISRETVGENPRETVGENPREIEGKISMYIGSEKPTKNNVAKPRGTGVDKEKEGEEQILQKSVSHGKEGEEQNLQNTASRETQNREGNRVCELVQSKSRRFEDNIKILLEKTESRLQASIESSINRIAAASAAGANFQPFGGFGPDMAMEIFLWRRVKELMDDLNYVKRFPGLNSAEGQELQQQWHALKIQEVRMFCENLELLQKQCRLILKNAESSNSTENQ